VTAERLARARRVLDVEGAAIAALRDRLDASFARAIELLLACPGKVVVTGMGKSVSSAGRSRRRSPAPHTRLPARARAAGDLGTLVRGDALAA
jgi:arabinose-5-phosphate isomerase